jgi:hypothetical protein
VRVEQCFPNCLPGKEPKIPLFPYLDKPLLKKTFTDQKTKRQLVVEGDSSSIANHLTKILAIFQGLFGIFHGISKYLNTYSTISRETLNDVPQNPGWKTLSQTMWNKGPIRFTRRLLQYC